MDASLVLGEWRPQYCGAPLVPAAFAAQAAASPNSPCLLAEDGAVLTFAQADAAATALARRLAAAGVGGRDVAVGILLDRSPAVVVAMLAVHKAGGCYVPLDPTFPADRLAIYVEDSGAAAVITEPQHQGLAASLITGLAARPLVLLYDGPAEAAAAAHVALPALDLLQPTDLAYIMFTSGSTGRPKGVMVPHGGVRDLVAFNVEHFGLGAADVFVLNSTVGFDSYVAYVFASLAVGGRLVVPGPTAHLDPVGMAELIERHGITIMECVPALAAEYLMSFKAAGARLASLTRFLTGGEALTPKLAADVYACLPGLTQPGGGLFNSYGPTEVTVTTITGHITPPFGHITMGRPDHNTHCYVVVADVDAGSTSSLSGSSADTAGGKDQVAAAMAVQHSGGFRLAALGEAGELWLSGPRLARGYRNRPDLTAAAFVANPFLAEATASLLPGADALMRPHYERAYRTGDLVRANADGTIDFLGRVDRQVKVNGVRLELGEVESALAAAPGVTHAAVKPWKDANGAYRLVGYVSPAEVDLAAAEAHLRSKLLPAMVPAQLVALDLMPRLPNGKIDAKALREPQPPAAAAAAAGQAPAVASAAATPLERLVAAAWADVLHLPGLPEKLDTHANFFTLGGSSLRAGLINSRVRRAAGLDIPGLLIFQHPTIHSMCAAIERTCGTFHSDESVGSSSDGGGSDAASGRNSDPDAAATVVSGGSGSAGKQHGAAARSSTGMPGWLSVLAQCAGLMSLSVVATAGFLPSLLLMHWLYGVLLAPEWTLALVSPLLYAASSAFLLLNVIAAKWLLLGRVRPGTVPIWGWFYVRWWAVRALFKATLPMLHPLLRNTPLLSAFYRALGAKVGRNVMIDSFNFQPDWDLLEIGDGVAIEADSHMEASHLQAGTSGSDSGSMTLARTIIGAGCTLLPQSIVSAGTCLAPGSILTPGTSSARLPAGPPSSLAEHDAVRTEPGALPWSVWVASTLCLVVLHSFAAWASMVPSVTLFYKLVPEAAGDWQQLLGEALGCWLRPGSAAGPAGQLCRQLWWSEVVSMALLPLATIASCTLTMWLLVPLKWLLVGRITQESMAKGGNWKRFRRHLWRSLVDGPFSRLAFLWTSTEMYNAWLRGLGSKVGRQCWLSEMFRCSDHCLYEVGDTASVCSMVSVIGATNGCTNRVKLGEACDVTNDVTLLPGVTVGKGAVLGLFTYGCPGQSFADHSVTLGDYTLKQGRPDVEAGGAAGGSPDKQLESAASRLIPTWQYVAYHVWYLAAALMVFTATQAAVLLPLPMASMSVLYWAGLWPAILCAPLYGVGALAVQLGYATLLKRVVLASAGNGWPIFKSAAAAKWQLMCLNIHCWQDHEPLRGSVFYSCYLRCMGASVGRGVCCLGFVAHEHDQVAIGDGAVIGESAFLLTHTVEARRVKVRPIRIGARATVGSLCSVLPDAALEDGAALADMSVVMKGETVPPGAHWAGVPACPVAAAATKPGSA